MRCADQRTHAVLIGNDADSNGAKLVRVEYSVTGSKRVGTDVLTEVLIGQAQTPIRTASRKTDACRSSGRERRLGYLASEVGAQARLV